MIGRDRYWESIWLSHEPSRCWRGKHRLAAQAERHLAIPGDCTVTETTRYIVLTHRKAQHDETTVDSLEELTFMLAHFTSGKLRSVESRGDARGALIEVHAQSEAEALAFADALPGVRAGVEKAVVIPLREYGPFRALADAML